MTAGRWGTCLFEVVQRAAVLIGAIEFGHVFIAPAGGTTSSATSHFVKADDDATSVEIFYDLPLVVAHCRGSQELRSISESLGATQALMATSNSPTSIDRGQGFKADTVGTCWQDASSGLPRRKAKE